MHRNCIKHVNELSKIASLTHTKLHIMLRSRIFHSHITKIARFSIKKNIPVASKEFDFKMPKRGSQEHIKMQTERKEQKKTIEESKLDSRSTPHFLTITYILCSIPQSISLYMMIWNDNLSDNFFTMFDLTSGWITLLLTMEGAAGCGLGYSDYLTKKASDDEKIWMRKKRLAFMKFSFIMSWIAMYYINTPTPNWLFPLILASFWNLFKFGTLNSYEMLPKQFFYSRTFLNIYNLLILAILWWKVRKAREEKLNLELMLFQRVESLKIKAESPELAI